MDAQTRDSGYRDMGELLRRARESARLPIDQAARMLHIRVRYLDAMEQGRLEELPGLPYARGYLQTYASFLGLDKDEILRRFQNIEEAMSARSIYFPQVLSKEKTPSNRLIWGGMAVALAIYVLWSVLLTHAAEKLSMVQPFPPAAMPGAEKMADKTPKTPKTPKTEDVACLKTQDALYPPCTRVREPEFRAAPWPETIHSVLELAE